MTHRACCCIVDSNLAAIPFNPIKLPMPCWRRLARVLPNARHYSARFCTFAVARVNKSRHVPPPCLFLSVFIHIRYYLLPVFLYFNPFGFQVRSFGTLWDRNLRCSRHKWLVRNWTLKYGFTPSVTDGRSVSCLYRVLSRWVALSLLVLAAHLRYSPYLRHTRIIKYNCKLQWQCAYLCKSFLAWYRSYWALVSRSYNKSVNLWGHRTNCFFLTEVVFNKGHYTHHNLCTNWGTRNFAYTNIDICSSWQTVNKRSQSEFICDT
jgi:hypothetical protein